MKKKLNTQEILDIVSRPDCYVRYLPNLYLQHVNVFECDIAPDKFKILELATTRIFKNKLLEMQIIYKDKSLTRIMRPDAKWHRPIVNDMLEIYHAIIKKYEKEQNQNQK